MNSVFMCMAFVMLCNMTIVEALEYQVPSSFSNDLLARSSNYPHHPLLIAANDGGLSGPYDDDGEPE